jgi:hypothetical protein
MLITAVSVAIAVLATDAVASSRPPADPIPPMVVRIAADSEVPSALVIALLAEADAIWRGTGVQFFWERAHGAREAAARLTIESPPGPPALQVTIGQEQHGRADRKMALGWIVFDAPTTPQREIYLSYANACALLESSVAQVGPMRQMTRLERQTLLARAMGRALAHELGHYLSASKVHTEKGLMKGVLSASELFGQDRARFTLTPGELQRMVARFTSIYVASLD